MYALGIGLDKDYEAAFKLYQTALELGDVLANANLGYCYEQGQGVEKDLALALKYYKAGADEGEEHAAEEYERLKNSMKV